MCDYSMHAYKSRAAKVGDKLVTNNGGMFDGNTAVCLLPGTEVKFDKAPPVHSQSGASIRAQAARFDYVPNIPVDTNGRPTHYRDMLRFEDGSNILMVYLSPGQAVTVLQLPVDPNAPKPVQEPAVDTQAPARETERV